MNKLKNNRGFTLIELLVVIAIIGLVASVVLASLNSARKKSRDARRVSDLKEIKLALSIFFDDNQRYPTNVEGLIQLESASAPNCSGQRCMPAVGRDPADSTIYPYFQCSNTLYHLGANLEESGHPVLKDDFDVAPSACAGTTIDSPDNDGCANQAGRYCYDSTP